MISSEKYKELLGSGLLLDHYFLLCNLRDSVKPLENKRIQGFINLLTKKEFIDSEGKITLKGLELIEEVDSQVEPVKSNKPETFNTWVEGLHKRCQDKLVALTGKTQVRDKIEKTAYSFLPNPVDLGKNLYKVITVYKMRDYDRLERCIMKYIDERNNARSWFPILEYYIMKNNKSRLATDYDNFTEEENVELPPATKFL